MDGILILIVIICDAIAINKPRLDSRSELQRLRGRRLPYNSSRMFSKNAFVRAKKWNEAFAFSSFVGFGLLRRHHTGTHHPSFTHHFHSRIDNRVAGAFIRCSVEGVVVVVVVVIHNRASR